MILELNLKRWS